MYTLIDKLRKTVAEENIPTVGFQTLLCVLNNGAVGADNYVGTKAEAEAIMADITVNMSANADGLNPVTLDKQYINVRTQAGTTNAFLEIVLTEAYVASIALPADVTRVIDFLTLPSNSEV